MVLTPMQYKRFVWPHNPRSYTIRYERQVAVHKIPFGRYAMQDVGLTRRVMSGEGEFFGPKAYDTFKELASTFYEGGPGVLIHPVWQTERAYFVSLEAVEEPLPDFVRYRFEFWEDWGGYEGEWREVPAGGESAGHPAAGAAGTARAHTVRQGETLWGIARQYGVELAALLRANPGIKNANLIYPGEAVRIP